jgi:tryptophan-rich sensory protein
MEKGRGMNILKLIVSIIICQFAGLIGYLFTRPAFLTWYASLRKPFFTPSDWVFGPVWIILYILMGIAAFLVWQKTLDPKQTRNALILFGVQLVLNAFWPFVFFGLKSPLAGLIAISILAAAILLTIQRFLGVSRTAGILLIPYFLWVSFASGLNLSIWYLNC